MGEEFFFYAAALLVCTVCKKKANAGDPTERERQGEKKGKEAANRKERVEQGRG